MEMPQIEIKKTSHIQEHFVKYCVWKRMSEGALNGLNMISEVTTQIPAFRKVSNTEANKFPPPHLCDDPQFSHMPDCKQAAGTLRCQNIVIRLHSWAWKC